MDSSTHRVQVTKARIIRDGRGREARGRGCIRARRQRGKTIHSIAAPAIISLALSPFHSLFLPLFLEHFYETSPSPFTYFLIQSSLLTTLCPRSCDFSLLFPLLRLIFDQSIYYASVINHSCINNCSNYPTSCIAQQQLKSWIGGLTSHTQNQSTTWCLDRKWIFFSKKRTQRWSSATNTKG